MLIRVLQPEPTIRMVHTDALGTSFLEFLILLWRRKKGSKGREGGKRVREGARVGGEGDHSLSYMTN